MQLLVVETLVNFRAFHGFQVRKADHFTDFAHQLLAARHARKCVHTLPRITIKGADHCIKLFMPDAPHAQMSLNGIEVSNSQLRSQT